MHAVRAAAPVVPDPAARRRGLQDAVVSALREPAAYGPGCRAVEAIETHISHVFLTGTHAYKIKKAIKLPFLDFGTLEARLRFCEREVALNRRTAPSLYLDVVPVVARGDRYVVGGDGVPVEWAVRMRQFPQDALLSRMLERGALSPAHIDALAESVAAFHATIARAEAGARLGTPEDALRLALDNFGEIGPLVAAKEERDRLDALRDWTLAEHALRNGVMHERLADGFVRECHGDLHLANVAWVDGAAMPFDCIEFDARLRWSDVASDVAFVAMDLRARGRPDFARRFVNRYLEITGDYGSVPLLRFFGVYRAMVRAKVASLRAAQLPAGVAATAAHRESRSYLDLAAALAAPRPRTLAVMHGFSGCGKTSLSQALVEAADIVRIRMDIERKRQHGFEAQDRTGSGIASGVYAPAASKAAYAHVAALAEAIVAADEPVVVDAAFLARWQRDLFRAAARRSAARFAILDLACDEQVLRERVVRRSTEARDASEADAAVLAHQLATHEPIAADEAGDVVGFDAAARVDATIASPRWRDWIASLAAVTAVPASPHPAAAWREPTIGEKVAFLSKPSSYAERPARVDLIETHLSFVFLTDRDVWKLKKPVHLDGLDCRSLDARHENTRNEIRLNRRLSTNVYLGEAQLVQRIDGSLALDGAGRVVDWLVRMRRLPADRMLGALIRRRALTHADVAAVMGVLMRFYGQAPVASMSAGEYRRRLREAIGATAALLEPARYALPQDEIGWICARLFGYLDRRADVFDARVRAGRIVEAHGDLRPEHVCVEAEPQVIDCLEFSQELRVQDCADELAFLALECERLGAPALREAIFAAYAEATGETLPDALVDFYQAYRALVRARIAIRHVDDPAIRDTAKWRGQTLEYIGRGRERAARCA